MSGFFGFFDYSRPGPGVPKNAPGKNRFVIFLEIYTRKFWNLVKLNMLYTLFNIPAILIALFVVTRLYLPNSFEGGVKTWILLITSAVFVCIPVLTVGPAQAGFTFVLRNYAREEHAFLWDEFIEHAKSNAKQSLIVCLIDLCVVLVLGFDLNYMVHNRGNFLISIASAALFLGFLIYLMMHMYIYPIMVTFKLSIKNIYKNALIFSLIRFLPNLGILLVCFFIICLSLYFTYGVFLFALIIVSTIGLITNFHVYPTLKKYLMDTINEEGK